MASTYPGAVDAARFTAAESATGDAQADATTALANAATADGKAVAAQADATTGISDAATAQSTADAAVSKATYDAHSVLAATIDDTPAAVTVAEQTLLGRKTGGNIAALTVAEGKTLLGLGTAAVVDVPASGDATSGQAVKGSDSRLSDARTPTAHKASHESGGSDAVTLAPAQITGTAVVTADARLSDARTPTAHKTSHQSGGSDEVTLAQSQVTDLTSDLGLKAPLASPTLTGVPTAPTAAVDTNTTQVATTAFTVAQGYAKIATEGWVSPIRTSGGYTAKTALYTATNDDRVIDCTSGTYTITLPTAVSQAGREFVVTTSGSGVITVDGAGAETVAGAATQSVSGRGHLRIVSDGSNWVVLDGSYTDESVGRRLFQWDANNSRWQMTYGDTGWRNITADLAGAYTTADPNAEVHIRRVNDRVEIRLARGASGTWTSGTIYTLPDAFRSLPARVLGHVAVTGLMDYGTAQESAATLWTATSGAGLEANGWSATNDYRGHLTYSTNSAWPTTLPGTAVGSIPA